MIKTGRKTSKEKGEGEVKEKEKVQSGEPPDFWRPQAEKSRLPALYSFLLLFLSALSNLCSFLWFFPSDFGSFRLPEVLYSPSSRTPDDRFTPDCLFSSVGATQNILIHGSVGVLFCHDFHKKCLIQMTGWYSWFDQGFADWSHIIADLNRQWCEINPIGDFSISRARRVCWSGTRTSGEKR